MSSSPTEKPTPKRRRDARSRGDVPVSRELSAAVTFAAGVLFLSVAGPAAAAMLAAHLRSALARAVRGDVLPEAALHDSAARLAAAGCVPLLVIALAAAVGGASQTCGLCSFAAAAPRWSRLGLGSGLRRLFSASQLSSVAVGVLKICAITAVAWHLRADVASTAARSPAGPAASALAAIARSTMRFAVELSTVLVACGVADLAIVRHRHLRALRMTLDEVRREQKEQDGDPQHKAERRRAHRALAAARPVSAATCVVVNPTHVAVALHHDATAEEAPVVVAKGSGDEARRIRTEARLAAVPVVQDVPLARALFRLADVGDEIPEELYQAAAAVLVHVHGLAAETPP